MHILSLLPLRVLDLQCVSLTGRLAVGRFLLAILVILLYNPAGNLIARILVTVLAMAGGVMLAMAVQADYREHRSPQDTSVSISRGEWTYRTRTPR